VRNLLVLLWISVSSIGLAKEPSSFKFPQDTFAFSNNLYFDYRPDSSGQIKAHRRNPGNIPDFSRHCFAMVRSELQFHRFAKFDPTLSKIGEDAYRQRIQQVIKYPPWSAGPAEKIVFPGYPNLYSFSADRSLLLQKNLGVWWPSYWRIGNWRIVFPAPRSGQKYFAGWLRRHLDSGDIEAVYITRFKPINHCLVAYRYTVRPNGDLVFFVYDVNQPGKIVHLTYRSADRSFYYDPSWYYIGGLVSAMKLYVSPLM
jgi:hypothetical protein